ncbi:MAG: DNA polymerase/3'-5' exonuclease PolX [Chitinophagia bacterium]|nr:DNA polymerase/3'-5' exonuclease PolX [Chitinophagia bacterium]
MTNKEIAFKFRLLASLMELHEENAFKIRSYNNAYLNIRKLPRELTELNESEISSLPGVGKAITAKITELIETGSLKNIEKLLDITPEGIVQMLGIKGLGAKKIGVIWKDLGVESAGELLYAVNENRLIDLKGFGAKTQENIKQQLEYFIESSDKQLYARIIPDMELLLEGLKAAYPEKLFSFCGELHMKNPIISEACILGEIDNKSFQKFCRKLTLTDGEERNTINGTPIVYYQSSREYFYYNLVELSTGSNFFQKIKLQKRAYNSEKEVFEHKGLPYYIPEFREDSNLEFIEKYPGENNIVKLEQLKGCIHNHSTYSDGVNTIEEMISTAEEKNYEYFVMTDHSKSAFYANGLEIERLREQGDALRLLDQQNEGIRIFSGIESDILSNGDLDYPDDVLAELDLVIASVHSNLKMDKNKATSRILKAIENPFTSILGHPTGRLLLSRKGYPLDMYAIIDACADHDVAIEINANPLRLDIDWRYVQYAVSKNVLLSINPDAHSIKGIDDNLWGVWAARKGALPISHCLNAMPLDEFEDWLRNQHEKRN